MDFTKRMQMLDSALIETIWTDMEDEDKPLTKAQVLAVLESVKEQVELCDAEESNLG